MRLTDQLLLVADTFAAATNRSRARVSSLIFSAGDRLEGVVRGKDVNTRSFERAMAWFSDNWPVGTAWPEGVGRPDKQAPQAADVKGQGDNARRSGLSVLG